MFVIVGEKMPYCPCLLFVLHENSIGEKSAMQRKPGLLAGMFVGIILVVLIGTAIIIIPTLTTPHTPSGNAIDPAAATFITDITTTSSVNFQTAAPGPKIQTFKKNTLFYVAFHLNFKNFDFHTHSTVYIQPKFYGGQTYVYPPMLSFIQQADGGFFEVQYFQPATGNVELYWCLTSDCSDSKLAQTTSFTVVA